MTQQQGRLISIARRAANHAPMEEQQEAEVTLEHGVARDSRGKQRRNASNDRQVTLLSSEAWQAVCAELGAELPWTLRRANLLVSGLDLKEAQGARLRIGALELEITEEVDPCARMDAQHQGLTAALAPQWRGGVACRILAEGLIRVGDTVEMAAAGETGERLAQTL